MDSLLDLSQVTNLALSLNNLEETRRRNDIAEQNSVSEQGRLKVMQDRLAVDQEQAKQQHFAKMVDFSKDPRIRSNPDLENQVFAKIGEFAGMPAFTDPETLNRGRESIRKTFLAMQSNDAEEAKNGLTELAVSASPDDLKKMVDSLKDYQAVHQNIENVAMMRELNQARFEQLHDKQAKVNAGHIAYTDTAQEFSTALKGTDSKEFAQAMKFAESFKAKGSTSVSKNIAALYGDGAIGKFTGPEIGQVGEYATAKASRYLDVANAAQQGLDLLEHGGELPKGVTKADLRERVLVGKQISSAYNTLATWAQDPFDATKLKDARSAFKIVESQRKSMDQLKESTQNEAVKIRQDAQSFRESEAYQKHLQFQRKTTAQNEFLAWMGNYSGQPTDKEAMKEAARIGMAYEVPAEDVWQAIKNPNKAGVEVTTNVDTGKIDTDLGKNMTDHIAKVIDKTYAQANSAVETLDGVDRIRQSIASGNITLGPGATLRNAANQISQLMGIGGKDNDERLANTRNAMRALAQFTLKARTSLRGEGQITEGEQAVLAKAESGDLDSFTMPDLKAFLDVTERAARAKYGEHQKMLGKARKNKGSAHLAEFYEMDPLPEAKKSQPTKGKAIPQKSTGAKLDALPSGAKQIGTSGGRPVFETPDGKRWIGE